jgi:hypothetical protein
MDEHEENLQQLETEHGEIKVFRTPAGPFAIRRPKAQEYQRMVDKVTGDGSKFTAQKEFVRSVCVYPIEKKEAAALLDTYPGLASVAASEATDMAGASFEAETRKG